LITCDLATAPQFAASAIKTHRVEGSHLGMYSPRTFRSTNVLTSHVIWSLLSRPRPQFAFWSDLAKTIVRSKADLLMNTWTNGNSR